MMGSSNREEPSAESDGDHRAEEKQEASRLESKSEDCSDSDENEDHLVIDVPEEFAENRKVSRRASFGQQFRALMIKTWSLKRRHWLWTLMEIGLPILCIFVAYTSFYIVVHKFPSDVESK
eukprot:529556_1